MIPSGGGHWDFRFHSFGNFLGRFLFFVLVLIADFPFFKIWFSVLVKNISGFWDLVSDVVFVFSYVGSGFSSMGNYASPLISNCIRLIRVLITGM